MSKKRENTLVDLKHNKEAISVFFKKNREPFIAYLLKQYSSLRREDAEDLYQESFLVLYQNVVSGKLTELTSSLSTYLFRIGINKTNDRFKLNENKQTCSLEEHPEVASWGKIGMEFLEDMDSEKEKIVYEVIDNMESPCREMLFGFYYDKYDMEELASRLGYKDASVAKASKYKCIQKIKNVIKKSFSLI